MSTCIFAVKMTEAAWATAEVLERLFRDSFDEKGFVREGAVPVLAKGTFAVVFKVRARARAANARAQRLYPSSISSSMKRCAHASQKHQVQFASSADANSSSKMMLSKAHGSCQLSGNIPGVESFVMNLSGSGSFVNESSVGWELH